MEQIYILLLVIYSLYNCVGYVTNKNLVSLNRVISDHTEACS